MRDTNLSRTTTQRALATPRSSSASEQTGQMAQAFKRAAADHADIVQRAYELYEKRGRKDGQALEDWLNAERQLAAAAGH